MATNREDRAGSGRFPKNFLALMLSISCFGTAAHGTITSGVTIPRPLVLDFETATPGNIASSDPLFAEFGIADIGIDAASFFADDFDGGAGASRAVWWNAGGLAIVDPGAMDNAGLGNFWFIEFTNPQTVVGFGTHDAPGGATHTIEFFDGATSVGSIVVSPTSFDLQEFTFESSVAFDRLQITNTDNLGFALDNITLSGAAITQGVTIPNSVILDFESATPGSISPGATLFSDFGITDVGIVNPSAFADTYESTAGSSRALWHNSAGLAIVDPGATGNTAFGDYWYIDLAAEQAFFGFGNHDASNGSTHTVEFFRNGARVGVTMVPGVTFLFQEHAFSSTIPFDGVRVRNSDNPGFALDNITLSTDPVSVELMSFEVE